MAKGIIKVSVTIPTYNHGIWLAECLESVINQKTNFSFEILVGEDASTDGRTKEILRKYAKRFPTIIKPVFRKRNIGGTKNVLDLYCRTKGEYIAHLDGDDMMLQGKLQKQADYLDKHSDYSMVGHGVINLYKDGTTRMQNPRFPNRILSVDDILIYGSPFTNSSNMFRKKCQTICTTNRPIIDYVLFIDRAICGPIGSINEILGIYRCDVGVLYGRGHEIETENNLLYAVEYAKKKGCAKSNVEMLKKRLKMVFSMKRLLLNYAPYREFDEWDWCIWHMITPKRLKYGLLWAHIFRHNEKLARKITEIWMKDTMLWRVIFAIVKKLKNPSIDIPE